MNYRNLIAITLLTAAPAVLAQKMDTGLSIHVTSVEGDDLEGQTVELTQTDWQVGYGKITLDADGNCSLKVYPGPHLLTIDREGFNLLQYPFLVEEGEPQKEINVTITEKTRDPFALNASTTHDAFTGRDDIHLSWNVEPPAFFDDFEDYEPFAIQFGKWTGIDADNEAAAALVGSYPNRGVMQYAQIINPLTVTPTWWYEYPVLRPYSGNQYVGFTRTNSGNANDDWLISPEITPGNENILSFMAKAADQYDERFMVYITTKTDNPTQADFIRLDKTNFETVDYKEWKKFVYDLSEYEGVLVKFAIRFVSHAARYGSFMLMLDDVYVGQADAEGAVKSRRIARSPYNVNEYFKIYLDGNLAETTDEYSVVLKNVAKGKHTLGVEAVYRAGKSNVTEIETEVPDINYSKVKFTAKANSILSPEKIGINLLSLEGEGEYKLTTDNCSAEIASIPPGKYALNVDEGAYEPYDEEIEIDGDREHTITLNDRVIEPYNLTSKQEEEGLKVTWNRSLIFSDSFEDYDDFASGSFGDWKTYDMDNMPVYPIGLGSQTNIVSFPGSGNATNPVAIPPMVFNPWATTPAMLPTDPAIAAATGSKSIIFFSPQMAQADKWLVSPLLDIKNNYILSVAAKAYSIYPETIEFGVSEGGDLPDDFVIIAETGEMPSSSWMEYQVDLSPYAGQTVRLAIHYTSVDAFLAQVDDFTVGPADGEAEAVDYGNIKHFIISLDGEQVATTTSPEYIFTDLTPGDHTVGVQAVYAESMSKIAELHISVSAVGEITVEGDDEILGIYDVNGREVSADAKGVLIVKKTSGTYKLIK